MGKINSSTKRLHISATGLFHFLAPKIDSLVIPSTKETRILLSKIEEPERERTIDPGTQISEAKQRTEENCQAKQFVSSERFKKIKGIFLK